MDAANPPYQAAAISHAETRTIIIGVMVAMFLAALDQTIVATALPTIGREFGNLHDLPWVVTSYLVAATAITPLYGKLSDIHGRRIIVLIAIITFIVGSIACALAPSMLALIIARAIQGLGGGGLISLAQTVVADVSAPRERGRYQAYFASVFATASLAGPVLGGLLAEHLHWSVIFWINVPLGALAFWMSFTTLKRLPRHERPHRLDVLGAALSLAATLTLMLALSWGGLRFPWISPQILGLVVASALLWALFAARLSTAIEPLIPLSVLRSGIVLAGTGSACFGMGTLIALTIFVPVFFESVLGLSAGESGLSLLPLTIGTVCGATISGRLMSKTRRYKRISIAGLAVAIAGSAVLAVYPQMPLGLMQIVMAMISFGIGTLLPVSTVAVQNAVAPHQLGTTTATMNFFRQLGGALMVALFGAILLGGGSAVGHSLQVGLQPGTGDSLVGAFRWMFAASALGFACALALLWLMEEKPLRGTAAPAVGVGE